MYNHTWWLTAVPPSYFVNVFRTFQRFSLLINKITKKFAAVFVFIWGYKILIVQVPYGLQFTFVFDERKVMRNSFFRVCTAWNQWTRMLWLHLGRVCHRSQLKFHFAPWLFGKQLAVYWWWWRCLCFRRWICMNHCIWKGFLRSISRTRMSSYYRSSGPKIWKKNRWKFSNRHTQSGFQ